MSTVLPFQRPPDAKAEAEHRRAIEALADAISAQAVAVTAGDRAAALLAEAKRLVRVLERSA